MVRHKSLHLISVEGRHNLLFLAFVKNDVIGLGTDYCNGYFATQSHRVLPAVSSENTYVRNVGNKSYELKDHLGNVRATVSDCKIGGPSQTTMVPELLSASNYYAFGMLMPGRNFNSNSYLFGFGSQEKDDEISGTGNRLSFGDYGYDPRLGRRWNPEPKICKYPSNSSYLVFANSPIYYADPDGEDIVVPNVADREPILKMINSKALGLYAFDNSGKLYQVKATGDANKYSKYYSDKLKAAIKDDDVINVKIGQTYTENGVVKDVDIDAGGGVTKSFTIKATGELSGPVEVTISGNENYKQQGIEGNMLEDKPEDILAHELVGHAIPKTVGSDTGNAVDNENKVRKEVKKAGQTTPSPLRKAAPSHGE